MDEIKKDKTNVSEMDNKGIERFTVDEVENTQVKEFMIQNKIEHIVETPLTRALISAVASCQ